MKHLATLFLALLAVGALTASPASAQITLNELRTDHGGADTDEYVELAGPVGAALTGLTLVVIGDGTGGCGIVENAIDLSPYAIQADGVFALRVSSGAPALTGYDATVAGSFENSDNLTFLIVTGWTGAVAADLDTDNNGTLDSTPWTAIVDQVGIYEGLAIDCITDEYLYTSVVVGPDGTFVPAHIFKCAGSWYIGPFIASGWPTGALDTPGSPNSSSCATPNTTSSWGKIKAIYR